MGYKTRAPANRVAEWLGGEQAPDSRKWARYVVERTNECVISIADKGASAEGASVRRIQCMCAVCADVNGNTKYSKGASGANKHASTGHDPPGGSTGEGHSEVVRKEQLHSVSSVNDTSSNSTTTNSGKIVRASVPVVAGAMMVSVMMAMAILL